MGLPKTCDGWVWVQTLNPRGLAGLNTGPNPRPDPRVRVGPWTRHDYCHDLLGRGNGTLLTRSSKIHHHALFISNERADA
jgi:hypothetical protein